MRKAIIKIVITFLITLMLLFNYRFITIYNQRFLIANFDKRETWSEIFNIIPDVRRAEYYDPPYDIRSDDLMAYEYYLVLYTRHNLYTVQATEFDIERVERLLSHEQIAIVQHEPVELWFYGLLYALVIIFPLMRKVDDYN